MTWPIKKIGEILTGVIFLVFATGFFFKEKYFICYLTLLLLVLLLKLKEMKEFSVNISRGIFHANFFKQKLAETENNYIETLKSNLSEERKMEESRKLIDEVFKLGFRAGGGKFNDINNVKIHRDGQGNITSIQYDEN